MVMVIQYFSISCPVGEFKISKMRTDLQSFKVYTTINICKLQPNTPVTYISLTLDAKLVQ